MVGFTLKQAGYEVTEAQDGREGLARAQSGTADLIITDLNMPNMNGIEMIAAIRQLPQYKFTPILMLTTESDESKKQAGRAAGATGWIIKPFNPEQLLKVIQKVLP
jgi:two-component system chemotaxis response regulator CheY